MRHYFSTLAPGRGPFPSKFPKFGLQNLPTSTYARTVARASINLGVQRREMRAADKLRTNDRQAKEFCTFPCQKFAPLSSLLNGAEFTLSVAKNVALFKTVPILRFVSVK